MSLAFHRCDLGLKKKKDEQFSVKNSGESLKTAALHCSGVYNSLNWRLEKSGKEDAQTDVFIFQTE